MIPVGRLQVATPATMAAAVRGNTEATAAVDERVIPAVGAALAADPATGPALAAAAGAAVSTEVAERDLIAGGDPRIPAAVEELLRWKLSTGTPYAVPFRSENGILFGGIYPDGTVEFLKLKGASGTVDEGATVSSRFVKACLGDSLTRGYSGGGDWPVSESWPGILGTLDSRATVHNLGMSGSTVDEIGLNVGALELVAQAAVSVPASGSVAVTVQAGIGWRPTTQWVIHGTLGTVPGTLTRPANQATSMTFVADAGRGGVTVPAGSGFRADQVHGFSTLILGAGRNDVSLGLTGTHGSVAAHVVAGTQRIVDWMQAQRKRVILWGTTNASNELSGSANYLTVKTINDSLAALYPSYFVDVRGWLVREAIYALGISPTAADTTAMNGDAPPPSVMADTIHPLKSTAPGVAALMNTALERRDWKA
ncbi:hypothetical protein C5C17_11845 [Pseudoclavibacter sp. RFBA6]|nr:hypothetical protein C5C17_11845 [Pseudoclavibacter sp. RFBA6]